MNRGSIFRAKYQMKWAGLILLVLPFLVYHGCRFFLEKPVDFWVTFFVWGIVAPIYIYSYVVGKIWNKVKKRYVDILIKKILNYHSMCVDSLIAEDYKRVEFILTNCLNKYDSSSIITYFIKGAFVVGSKDIKSLKQFESELNTLRSEE